MDTYLHISLMPTHKPGEAYVDIQINGFPDSEVEKRLLINHIPALNAPLAEDGRVELWIVAALRNALSAVEADMFTRLTEGQEKLTLETRERKKDLGVPALTPCPGRQ